MGSPRVLFTVLVVAAVGLLLWWQAGPEMGKVAEPAESGRTTALGADPPSPARPLRQGRIPATEVEQRVAEGLVTGRVTDDEFKALAGVRVSFEPEGAAALTDSQGYYELAVPAATGWVRASLDGFLPVRRPVDAKTADRIVRDFVLPQLSATLEGTVREALSGLPVEGISVTVSAGGRKEIGLVGASTPSAGPGDWGHSEALTTRTDSAGHFVQPVPAGRYLLQTSSERHIEDVKRGSVEPGETNRLALRVFVVETMELRVTDDRGEGVAAALIDRSDGLQARTDDEGEARFPLTPATIDERFIRVYSPGYLRQTVRLPARQTRATVELVRGPEVVGIVVDPEGRSVAGARVQPRGTGWRKLPADPLVITDVDGTFRFHIGSPPLDELVVRHPGFVPQHYVTDEIDNEGPFTIVLERARGILAGEVRDDAGRPLRHFEVRLQHPTRQSQVLQSETFHDEHGRFRMELRPGVYRVVAHNRSPRGYGWRSEAKLVAIPDQSIEEVTLGPFRP